MAIPFDWDNEPFEKHPRYNQWVKQCEILAEASRKLNDPTLHPPSFRTWLRDKEEQESESPPKIRGDNPPLSYAFRAADLDFRASAASLAINILVPFLAIYLAYFAYTDTAYNDISHAVLFIMSAGLLIAIIPGQKEIEALRKDAAFHRELVPVDAYNTDFACPLADHSTVRITVHFQIPRELNTGRDTSSPSHFVEQLNRVTEVKLVTHTQQFSVPPPKEQVEHYLQTELVQFQNENSVSILRVNVPLIIHVHPDKPKGVHV